MPSADAVADEPTTGAKHARNFVQEEVGIGNVLQDHHRRDGIEMGIRKWNCPVSAQKCEPPGMLKSGMSVEVCAPHLATASSIACQVRVLAAAKIQNPPPLGDCCSNGLVQSLNVV